VFLKHGVHRSHKLVDHAPVNTVLPRTEPTVDIRVKVSVEVYTTRTRPRFDFIATTTTARGVLVNVGNRPEVLQRVDRADSVCRDSGDRIVPSTILMIARIPIVISVKIAEPSVDLTNNGGCATTPICERRDEHARQSECDDVA